MVFMVLPPTQTTLLYLYMKLIFHGTFKQLSTFPGTERRMKAVHYPITISLVPGTLSTSTHKAHGSASCHVTFSLSIFTFRGVLFEVRLFY